MRLAFIVSHPVQYYVPIYRKLARLASQRTTGLPDHGTAAAERRLVAIQPTDTDRKGEGGIRRADDSARISALKVFYTWRDARASIDHGFGQTFAWDIPLTDGYEWELVPNTSTDPGTHHRKGLVNPDLVPRVKSWKPDAVHITGYNYVSHGQAIKELSKAGIPVIFRGDSHLLDGRGPWWRWILKKSFLSKVYSWPKGFAYVGQANRDYYRAFGVPEPKLFHVPHTIEVGRFAEPNDELEAKALAWRRELGIPDEHFVFLYAAKLEPRKRPVELLEAFLAADLPRTTLLFVGSGELEGALKEKASHREFSHGLTRIGTDKFSGGDPAGKSLLPRNAADKEQSFSHSRPEGTEDSPQANRQLEELSEAVKLTQPTGRETALRQIDTDTSDRHAPTGLEGECSHRGTPGARHASSGKTEDCKLHTANCARRVVFLEFQNQSRMPLVYRLGDALVLPSGYGETWGLAVNEAQACGRPSLVSDCVGCARDIIREGENGMIFRTDDWEDCVRVMRAMVDAWSGASEGRRLRGERPEAGGREWEGEKVGRWEDGGERRKDQELKRPKDEEPRQSRDSVSPAVAGRGQTKGRRDEESSISSRREAIRAGAWDFDTARGVEALLAGFAAASETTGRQD